MTVESGGIVASGRTRRGRVVARQLYVFDVGHRLGWASPDGDPVAHGCEYLFAHLHRGGGEFATSIDAVTHEPVGPFSLFEHTFYLFALARVHAAEGARHPVSGAATLGLERLRRDYGRSDGGFDEADPPTLPLQSNPHMHALEAALAWLHVTKGGEQQPWASLAAELVNLCMTRFIDPASGLLREYFDAQWRPVPGDAGRRVEPGHQFEWAWLLMEWCACGFVNAAERTACLAAADRLVGLGERCGVDPVRGVAINEIWDDGSVKDAAAKLWPQTERIKAWCAILDRAEQPGDTERACRGIVAATQGLLKYLQVTPRGLWREVLWEDGTFLPGPTKASSLYHIVGSIEALRRAL